MLTVADKALQLPALRSAIRRRTGHAVCASSLETGSMMMRCLGECVNNILASLFLWGVRIRESASTISFRLQVVRMWLLYPGYTLSGSHQDAWASYMGYLSEVGTYQQTQTPKLLCGSGMASL